MNATDRTLVERIVLHERAMLVATLVAVPLACWSWIVPMARDMYGAMTGPSAWMMTAAWDTPHLLLLGAMWIVMMAGMMLPSAAPTLLLYAATARRRSGDRQAAWYVYAMAAGYLVVWAAFSVCATLLQRILSALLVLSPAMELTSPLLSGALLIGAGVYQLTPLKRACLASCSSPLVFLTCRWREGGTGAFRLGVEHGLVCVGCCWALMLLLFAGGVMNLAVIGALTAFVLFEKLAPLGARAVRLTGVLLIAAGAWVVASSHQAAGPTIR
jgi:predicted metal-binding membrane protein